MDDDLKEYSPGEVAFVMELLAAMRPMSEIQTLFEEFTEGKKAVTKKAIQSVASRYCKKISELNALYLKNIKGNPLSHQRVRLDVLNRIVNECMTKQPSHSLKVGDSDYEVVYKADFPTAIQALKLAMADLNKREELDWAKEKNAPLSRNPVEDWEVEDGITQ